ncbi:MULTISPECIES: acetyl-CoA C-acetyltransferase [Saccharolobus]|jgi:acetyl-CoA C-acetyltransferase|uniref:acetyl-CoA C-acyltransferase n=5 Tax=Saccharolobus TaxID=2100760 RepID=Q97VV9_SACS2|nr:MULTISPECIES: acetyl-CoA C-acetyltransferase [Sulfolobaceae]AAK42631.1 Acetyl-CoA c-acetyltransferase (acetoacetyl-CoA thiolase) (acaB-5) [Saccharolobus solfataricus P2]ACP34469.1 acetyl-CoA acetyltransferase [Sulfolobus islandicus L.S.2.15]ACP49797.1 acetyl-CoA acetyltransferase [Sulfolobus islandicus Y.N.15.51]ACP54315.1 acetyl-CoA acetyltransferase [Sulfolobus islandicus M.16.27]ADB86091.1 acetyl-CoA acetyltransferase [Sulfolobus islandicus L.D.8.5]
MLEDVYLVDYARTAFTRFSRKDYQKDPFYNIRPEELAGMVINRLIEKNGIKAEEIDEIITGCALQVGEQWAFGGRHEIFAARLPYNIPTMAVDRQCASSLTTVSIGAMEISTGMADIVLAGGVEKLSRTPMFDNPHIEVNTKFLTDSKYIEYDLTTGYVMGLTAEKLAEEARIKREEMDRWSLRSHQLAWKAIQEGYFKDEILPIEVEVEGKKTVVNVDQSVRPDTSIEKLGQLPPAFKPNGTITAGNSAPLNSGASYVLLMSKNALKKYGLTPMAKIRSFGFAGVPPAVMGKGPVPASKKALEKANLSTRKIDLWEINEAFAVVVLYAIKQLELDESTVNKKGGAIAIGHPLGATGARLVGTLARQLIIEGKDYGVATLCVGGGQGGAIVLERV